MPLDEISSGVLQCFRQTCGGLGKTTVGAMLRWFAGICEPYGRFEALSERGVCGAWAVR